MYPYYNINNRVLLFLEFMEVVVEDFDLDLKITLALGI